MQYSAPSVEAPEGVIDDWEFFWSLSREMGVNPVMKPGAPAMAMNYGHVPGGIPLDTDSKPTPEELLRIYLRDSRVTFEDLKASPQGIYEDGLDERVLYSGEPSSARLDLAPEDVCRELDDYLHEAEPVGYSYRLIVRRVIETMNSTYIDASMTKKRSPNNFLYMNRDDMTREGFSEGQMLEVWSSAGRLSAIIKADKGQQPGVVSMTHLWGGFNGSIAYSEEEFVGMGGAHSARLVSSDLTDLNFMPQLTNIPVNLSVAIN